MTNEELRNTLRQDVVLGAQVLIGATLVHGKMQARIVETEAYRGADDPASHAFRGPTPRNQVMFGPPGFAYVYFSYGAHWMLNVTCLPEGQGGAVLIRAAMPLAGLEEMRLNRPSQPDRNLLNGPGKLAKAMAIDRSLYGLDLLSNGELRIEPRAEVDVSLLATPRVGIAQGKGHETPWRFVEADRAMWASR